jgi:hypothetical protein
MGVEEVDCDRIAMISSVGIVTHPLYSQDSEIL